MPRYWIAAVALALVGALVFPAVAVAQHDNPGVDLEKFSSVDGPSGPWNNAFRPETSVGNDVWMRIWLQNTGNSRLTNISLTDVTISGDGVDYQASLNAALGSANCPNLPDILAQGATWECLFGPFTALDGLHENRATVSSDSIDEQGDINYTGITDNDPAGYVGVTPIVDSDGDGISDSDDVCPDTVLPDQPTRRLKGARFAAQTDGTFDSGKNKFDGLYTLADTNGCAGDQIIEREGLGKGHTKFGISKGALEEFIATVNAD